MTKPNERQKRLIAFFQSPGSYGHQPESVRLIETHISWVFIASPFVFKVKKPINLGFADFSSLQKRRYFCARELNLNRRLAPDVYLEVIGIYSRGGSFSFAGESEPVEYALKMRELAAGFFLNELLANDCVGQAEIDRIVACLRRSYMSENPGRKIEEWGRPEKLKISTDENFVQVKEFVGKTVSAEALGAIRDFTNSFYAAHERLFDERIAQERILDCHGDLRLDHVHITPEVVAIFDCIEFNDRLRFIDIANDLAFLAMDFDFRDRRDLANLFLQTAASKFGDPGVLQLANFYKCYRAVVRGKVESIQALAQDGSKTDERAIHATRYFRLALRYAIGPLLIAVMGRIATGKSTLARELANHIGWPVFSSDHIRKNLAGLPLTERTSSSDRANVYSESMTRQTYTKLFEQGFAAIATIGGAVIDATFSRRENRDWLRAECVRAGIRYQLVELQVDDAEIRKRLQARGSRQTEISDARLEDFEKLSASYEPPTELGADLIQVSNHINNPAEHVLLRLAEKNARQ